MSCNPSAVMSFNSNSCLEEIHVFYQGPGNNGELYHAWTNQSLSWQQEKINGAGISNSPSAVVFQLTTYVFFQGSGNPTDVYGMMMDSSGNWVPGAWGNNGILPNVSTISMPSAFYHNGSLYVSYDPGGNTMYYVATSDGVTWSEPVQIAQIALSQAPALTVLNGNLYCLMQAPGKPGYAGEVTHSGTTFCAFTGPNGQLSLMYQNTTLLNSTMDLGSSPGVATFGSTLYCFETRNGSLFYNTYDDSSGWSSQKLIANGVEWANTSPSAIEFANKFYVFCENPGGGAGVPLDRRWCELVRRAERG
ncbi:hypothetical protein [Pseudomonas chlororaphis]|uniref:hypothetical protein n=1 Tax=Pseudomonas chlororaphis TaxID=587753 RepID=UPI000AF9F960|nr:hypothetical protein [Pseudomonas chlororaphis]